MTKYLRGKAWMFALLPLLFAHLLIISPVDNGLGSFLRVTLNLAALLAPLLLFVALRDAGRWPAGLSRWVWPVVFLLCPAVALFYPDLLLQILFSGLGPYAGTLDPQFPFYFFPLFFGSALATEVLLWWRERQTASSGRLSSALVALAIGLSFSLLVCVTNAQSWYALALWPQLFLVFLVFYGYFRWNAGVLIPGLLRPRGVVVYGFGVVGTVLLTYPFAVALFHLLPAVEYLEMEILLPTTPLYGGDAGGTALLVMVLSAPFLISSRWLRSEAERSAAELQLLKQQIDPHFFFNTLNNLYALSIDEDKRTPDVILRLSDLMRYVIYSGKEDRVPLAKSLEHLENYQHLQGIRLARHYDYRFTRDLPAVLPEVPPLLFINLVENAFKHGIEPATGPTFLHLDLRLRGNVLTFRCANSVEQKEEPSAPGVGLVNLRRRLALLYPGRHELRLAPAADRFLAVLTIEL